MENHALRHWLFEPLLYTLSHRRNFFRTGMLRETARMSRQPGSFAELAACIEIAWTCALILDDIQDASKERDGEPAAHVRYGVTRCLAAIMAALPLVFARLTLVPSGVVAKARLATLSISLLWKCTRAQIRCSPPSSLIDYRSQARDLNVTLHWALLAPLHGDASTATLHLLRTYADHSAVAGKMHNDLADYWGGSSEREGRFEDFSHRKVSLPVLLLLDMDLDPALRRDVAAYFHGDNTISLDHLLQLFNDYAVLRTALSLIGAELCEVRRVIQDMRFTGLPDDLLLVLDRWNQYLEQSCWRWPG
jgi:geranylgeranyl pyrophosphate synthase